MNGTAAVITTRNEAGSIEQLVRTLLELGAAPVVVDAASGDGTAELAHHAGAQVIRIKRRLPIGPALMRGWRLAIKRGAEHVVQLDAGGSHDPYQVYQMAEPLRHADMVIGSRFMPGGCYLGTGTRRRRMSSWAFAKAFNLLNAANFTDVTSGYRAFRASLLATLLKHRYRAGMHGWQVEVLRAALGAGAVVVERPIRYRAGTSSLSARVAWEALRVLLV